MAKRSTRAAPHKRSELKEKKPAKGLSKKAAKKPGKKRGSRGFSGASKLARNKKPAKLLARAGGSATTAGVSFQASVGAVFAVQMLADGPMDNRLGLGGAKPCGIRFESEAAVDDCGVETDGSGWIFVQAKTGFSLSDKAESDLRKTAGQIVRLWHSACRGRGKNGWDRPLDLAKDRLLIAAGPNSSGSITRDLARALDARRAKYSAPLPKAQKQALDTLIRALKAEWKTLTKQTARDSDIRAILPFIVVIAFDMAGADRLAAIAAAGHLVTRTSAGANAFVAIEKHCQQLMEGRLGSDAAQFRTALSALGIPLKAPPRYEADVTRLSRYSDETRRRLAEFEKTVVSGVDVTIPRDVTGSVVDAAKAGSFLVVGEPGAGKSAVISAAAAALRKQKYDVVELAVDQLAVETAEGMRIELGLDHRLIDVLDNWPGAMPGFLIIDALDATRGGAGERVFRALIEAVMNRPVVSRWRVIASIRSFDLRMGERLRILFKGAPPAAAYASKDFADIRHIAVPPWNDVEFAALRANAPALDLAIARGGEKLRDLARVPFNTRLLAELLTNGATPETFNSVASQVELLALYWRKRVEQHGSGAELCLGAAVAEMVGERSLRARRTTAAAPDPAALDAVLKDGVVTLLSDNRLIGFRHHILFDYAASRLFIDPLNIAATVERLRNDRGLSLMLAPAIGFALQSLWENGEPDRQAFWSAVCLFAGGAGVDPVARSIASRVASELPESNDDVEGFLLLIADKVSRQAANIAFAHVVGAITVRADDGLPVADAVWCHFAARISSNLEGIAWPLRTLLTRFSKRIMDVTTLADLGTASRALFSYVLDHPAAASLMPIAIELVADSYRSNAAASRALLSKTLAAERLANHAHEDIPALTRQATTLLKADADFLVEIFGVVFSYTVSDDSATSMGSGQIVPLTSNKRQDYDHAKWTLKEIVPRFLVSQPELAIRAIGAALEGYARRKYGNEQTINVVTAGGTLTLIADHSYIWASNPDDRHAHADNTAAMILAFKRRLETAGDDDARLLAQCVIRHARAAVLWARLFLVGAKRVAVLGTLLWPYAREPAILRASDTTKDAVDLVAAVYPLIDATDRQRFEENAFAIEFPDSQDPDRARLRFLGTLFGAIGAPNLATEQARLLVEEAAEKAISTENRRPVEFTMTGHAAEPYYWLSDNVDIHAPANAALLRLVEQMDAQVEDVSAGLAAAEAVAANLSADNKAPAAQQIREYAGDQLGYALEKLAAQKDSLRQDADAIERLWSLVSSLLRHERPTNAPGTGADRGPRASATEAALRLCTISQAAADVIFPEIDAMSNDANAGVRFEFADHVGCLWEFRRDDLWRILQQYVANDSDSYVLRAVCGFLCRAVHHGVEKVENLALQLYPRAGQEEDPHGDRIVEGIASIVAVLWTRYDRPRAHSLIEAWISEPEKYESELLRVISTMRGHIVDGYRSGTAADIKMRKSVQTLASEIVASAAACLDDYYAKGDGSVNDAERARIRVCARLVDHVGDQLYFSTGAAAEGSENVPLASIDNKRAFLRDMAPMMRRLGDVGIPHTIYYFVELLDFLRPADPESVFDLIAHALLKGGARNGYQFESLATDKFVAIVGVYLADHRGIFASADRREKLIACLDSFVDAGWPAARRLLYRLPELL